MANCDRCQKWVVYQDEFIKYTAEELARTYKDQCHCTSAEKTHHAIVIENGHLKAELAKAREESTRITNQMLKHQLRLGPVLDDLVTYEGMLVKREDGTFKWIGDPFSNPDGCDLIRYYRRTS